MGYLAGVGYLHEEMVAAPDAASAARRSLSGFLTAIGWSRAGRTDLIIAVSEAVTNAAQHAYLGQGPGLIVLRAHLVSDRQCRLRVWMCVTDQGQWPEQPSRPLGRGVPLMRDTTAHLSIETGAGGTRVTMISHPDAAVPVRSRPDSSALPAAP